MELPWDEIDLVVFDVDGTLYDQHRLRRQMLGRLALAALQPGGLTTLRILRFYRWYREVLAERGARDFESELVATTSKRIGVGDEQVRAVVAEWIEARPLPLLKAQRFAGLPALFSGLKRHGKIIGILSDYPATNKLQALELSADHIVSAVDSEVGVLKPDPRGLECLIEQAGVSASRTVMIGDRVERDGEAAQRAGTLAAIRSSASLPGWRTFRSYADDGFAAMMR